MSFFSAVNGDSTHRFHFIYNPTDYLFQPANPWHIRRCGLVYNEVVYAMRLTCQVNSVPGFVIRAITVNGGVKADIGLRECARITPDDVEVLIA